MSFPHMRVQSGLVLGSRVWCQGRFDYSGTWTNGIAATLSICLLRLPPGAPSQGVGGGHSETYELDQKEHTSLLLRAHWLKLSHMVTTRDGN